MAVNRTKVLEAAQKFLSKGQFDKAIAEYQKLVNEDPRDVRTLLKIGDLHTRRNKPKDAIDVYLQVAELYAKQGFFLKAVAVYKQILKLDATHLDSTQRLAKMYEELGLTSDALTTYEQVSDAYLAQGQTAKALDTMQRMVELDATNVAVRIKHAEALSKADRAKEAATAFAEGAQLLKEQGRMDDYIRVVERQLYHDPDNLDVARELSSLYLERSDPKRALAKLQVCFKADPRDIQTLEMLAEAFRQLGQIPKTISVLKEIARLHAELGAQEPRRRTLKRVLDLDPNDAEAKQGLAGGAPAPAAPAAHAKAAAPAQERSQPVQQAAAPPPAAPAPSEPTDEPDTDADVDLELEASFEEDEELDLLDAEAESTDDEVLIVDDDPAQAPHLLGNPKQPAARAESTADKIARLLAEADERENAGGYAEAEDLLKQILTLDPDHAPTHERLKDLYLSTDRRVDAVRELLWLSDSWTERNTERAIQHARAAYELAPHSDATRSRLRMLGVDPNAEASEEEVMFFEEGQASQAPIPDTAQSDADAELDAILPRVSEAPRAAATPDEDEGRMSRATLARESGPLSGGGDLLDLPISPDEFDAAPPVSRRDLAANVLALLEQPLSPEEFEAGAAAELHSQRPAERFDSPATENDMEALLDAPISPDEFDAAPPRPDASLSEDVEALLEKPLPADDFGLSDERFERSGLMDVEPAVAPAELRSSSLPPLTPAQLLSDDEDGPPSLEFAEIGTGDIDIAEMEASLPAQADDAPEPGPPTFVPASTEAAVSAAERMPLPLLKAPPPPAKVEAPRGHVMSRPATVIPIPELDLTSGEDLLEQEGPDPTVPGAPIPDLLRRARPEIEALPDTVPPRGEPTPPPAREASFSEPDTAPETPLLKTPAPPQPQPLPAPYVAPAPAAAKAPAAAPAPAAAKAAPAAPTPAAAAVAKAPPAAAPAPQIPKAPKPEPEEKIAPEIEEVLDEADFFASQGLMDEALEVVQEAILIYPTSKALRARLLEYEAKADAQEEAEEQAAEQADESFDIAEQLASELAEVPAAGGADEMVDVESVFAQFKKGVAQQISPEDSDTHFDLGIAYKEMGLTDDAVQEFELAAKNPKRACTSLTMIGMCHLEKGDIQLAANIFERALATESKSPAEELALHYEIGNAHELLGHFEAALASFEKVAARDRSFRGVAARLDQLKKRSGHSASASR